MYEIIGIKPVDYVNRSGNRVLGKTLYLAYTSEKIDGFGVKEVFANDNVCPSDLKLKDNITVLYNEFGGVARIEYINK